MLILFDIDMTLINTGGSGMKAMNDAGRELFGPAFSTDGIEFAGRLDPLIISDMLLRRGVEDSPSRHQQFRAAYRRHLEIRLSVPGVGRALPGVQDVLGTLRSRPQIVLGLLTGNFEETGTLKLRACGIDPSQFTIRVWGDESPHRPPLREHLVPVGISRAGAARGTPFPPGRVTVIGDTPHDVHCARTHGCRSLAVATGRSTSDQLRAAGADLVLQDLSDVTRVVSWLENGV